MTEEIKLREEKWQLIEAFIGDRLAEMLRERGNSSCMDEKSFDVAKIYLPDIIGFLKREFLSLEPRKLSEEKVTKIILQWLRTARPDDSDIPSVLSKSICEAYDKGELYE